MDRDKGVDSDRYNFSSRGHIVPPRRAIAVECKGGPEIAFVPQAQANVAEPIEIKSVIQPSPVEPLVANVEPVIAPITKPLPLIPIYTPMVTSKPQITSKPIAKVDIQKLKYASKPKITKVNNIEKHLARTANKARLLDRAVENSLKNKKKKKWFNKLFFYRFVVSAVVILILGITGFVSFNTWQTNIQAKQVIKTLEKPVSSASDKATKASFPAGTDTSTPAVDVLASYKVAADLPRAIYINKINVSARVMPMGLTDDNSIQAPTSVYDAGWYTGSSKPGKDGAVFIDGHASESGTHYGLFGYLNNLKVGDQITIERGDGVSFNYKVANIETVPTADVDMKKMLMPYNGSSQGINMIACTGKWNSNKTSLDHRILVYAIIQ